MVCHARQKLPMDYLCTKSEDCSYTLSKDMKEDQTLNKAIKDSRLCHHMRGTVWPPTGAAT